MSVAWMATRRVLFAVVAAYLVVSVAFGFVALTPDPNEDYLAWQMARSGHSDAETFSAIQAYREARNYDDPLGQRYANWLVDITTLDWGVAYSKDRPVMTVLGQAVPYTLAYVVPATLLSLLGVLVGYHSALRRTRIVGRVESALAYVGFGIPNFYLAEWLLVGFVAWSGGYSPEYRFAGAWSVADFALFALPSLVLATGLFAAMLRYTRSGTLDRLSESFVEVLRAKGVRERSVARHVLRNLVLPLASLLTAELVGVLVLNVLVIERVFGIPGLGTLVYGAIVARDIPLVLGVTMVVVFAGIGGNLLHDLAALMLDPRMRSE